MALLVALPNEVERLAAFSQIINQHPTEVGPLCSAMPAGPTRRRCRRVDSRHHLFVERPDPSESSSGATAGETPSEMLTLLLKRPATLQTVTPDAGPCIDGLDVTGCLLAAARDEVKKGTVSSVAARCKAVPLASDDSHQWRSECFFQAAEAWVETHGFGAYATAVELCSEAGSYLENCHKHLVRQVSFQAPLADVHDPLAWGSVTTEIKALLDYWKGARAGAILASEVWATAMELAVRRAETLSGDAIDQTSPSAHFHLRASVAARLLSEGGAQDRDLEAWATEVMRVLALREGGTGAPTGRQTLPRSMHEFWPNPMWAYQSAVAAGHPMIRYRGPEGIRVQGADIPSDVRICVLEAAARLDPPVQRLLDEGALHPSERVRWTAKALTGHLRRNPAAAEAGAQP